MAKHTAESSAHAELVTVHKPLAGISRISSTILKRGCNSVAGKICHIR